MAAKRRTRSSAPADLDWLLAPYDALLKGLASAWAALRSQLPARLFVLVFLLGLGLRLVRPDWYANRLFHPDERWIFDKTAELSWPGEPGRGDPAGLQYGSLPMYSVALVKDVMVKLSGWTHHGNLGAHDAVVLAGRTLTGVVDALSVLGTYLLGVALLGAWPALLASLVVACAPLQIQLAHFFTVDPWLTALAVLTLAAAVPVARRRGLGWSAFSGALFGLALACKSSGLPLVLSLLVAHLWPAFEPGLPQRERRGRLRRAGVGLAVAAASTLAAFFVAMPWAFLDFAKFVANQTAQKQILVIGAPAGVPFVRQYWDTGIFFHLKNIAFFYLGVPAGPLAILAVFVALGLGLRSALRAWRPAPTVKASPRRSRQGVGTPGARAGQFWEAAFMPALLLAWVLPYYAIVGFSFAKFARYMLPILPELAVLLAGMLLGLRERWRGLYRGLVGLVAVGALAHGIGYGMTYFRPHPWIEASRWIYQNVPARTPDPSAPGGSRMTRILNEDWGDDLPVEVDGQVIDRYDSLKGRPDQVNIVEWDSPQKLSRLAHSLSQTDVIVLADPRGYGTYLRLPHRFPLTHAYYDLLFHDPARLGFKLAHEASNPVKVLGFSLPDSRTPAVPSWLWADESFTLYDRPHAFIFTRVSPLSDAQARQVLLDHVKELGLSMGWMDGQGPEELERIARGVAPVPAPVPGPAQPQALNPNLGTSRGAMVPLLDPVLAWWFLATLLGALALPLTARLLGAFPAGGYALSRALGVLLFGWLAYNLAWLRVGGFRFIQSDLWLLLAALGVAAALSVRARRAEAVAWLKAHWREVVFTEAVFAGAFLFFVLVRAYNPNIHDITGQGYFGGGEPLGMTYLSAVTRCSTFPAFDPWLSGANSSYYYFGYVLAATLTKLSGYPPAITYNLSLAFFFSLSLVSAYGLLRGLVPQRWVALGGAAMVGLAGSLWTLAYIAIQGSHGFNWISALFSHGFIWDPTRFPELVNGHIFEFPYFSYLYADLHPHNMVIGFSLLLLALYLAPFLSKGAGWRSAGETPGRALLWLGVTALVLDSQYAINTWSWPVFVALGAGCFLIGPWAGKGLGAGGRWRAAAWGLAAFATALVLGRFVLMFGFRHYYLQNGGDRVGVVLPSEWQMSAYIPLAYFLPGLVALAVMGGARLRAWGQAQAKPLGWDRLGRKAWDERALILGERLFDRRPVFTAVAALWLLLVAGLLGWATLQFSTQGVWALALGLGLACLGLFALGGSEAGPEAWLWVLGGFSCFLVAGAEHWYVADRMNTIFKFWINGWILLGVVYGAGFAAAFSVAPPPRLSPAARRPQRGKSRKARFSRLPLDKTLPWLVAAGLALALFAAALLDAGLLGRGVRFEVSYLVFGLLMLGALFTGAVWGGRAWWAPVQRGIFLGLLGLGLLYPLGATAERIREASGFTHPHLDGLQFMADRQARPGLDADDYDHRDLTLIRWLNQHADVTEPVLEAPGLELYKGYSRFAIYTGLPTLLGWDYQEGQQLGERTGGILQQREHDAAVMYGPDDAAAVALLKAYKVRWIVVGGIERKLYPAAGLDKFAHLATLVAQDGGSLLYRFDWDKP